MDDCLLEQMVIAMISAEHDLQFIMAWNEFVVAKGSQELTIKQKCAMFYALGHALGADGSGRLIIK